MTNLAPVVESDATRGISFETPSKILSKEELTSSLVEKEATPRLPKKKGKMELYDFGVPSKEFFSEAISKQDLTNQIDPEKETVRKSELPPWRESFVQAQEEPFVAIHREELYGYVKKIAEGKAYIVFETPGEPLERVVRLSKLEAIHADHQGALIRLVVKERGASTNIKFENLEEKGIATWRDKIKDEDLEKFDLLEKSALPRKPSKLQ